MYVAKTNVQEWAETEARSEPTPHEVRRGLEQVELVFRAFQPRAGYFSLDQAIVLGWAVYRQTVGRKATAREPLGFDETLRDHALALDREEHEELSEFLGTGEVTKRHPAKTVRDLARAFLVSADVDQETK